MDTLTHALSGALLVRATGPKNPRPDRLPRRTRMWVGFLAAAFPDSDFALLFLDPLTYLTAHRGITHSVVMLPLWAALLAGAFMLVARGKYPWRAFAGVCALGIGAHIAGDVITAFGTMVFAPLSDWRAQIPTTFIIDPYFSAILVAGLLASAFRSDTRVPAIAGLAVLAAYVGFQWVLHGRAVAVGEDQVARLGLRGAAVHAIPQPFSPFNWMLVLEQDDVYRLGYLSLIRGEAPAAPPADALWLRRVAASYRPVADLVWDRVPRFGESAPESALAEQVWRWDGFARYRGFALFPAVYRVDRGDRRACVWFNDLRFALPDRSMPFRYGACRDGADAAWKVYRLLTDANGQEIPDAIQ